MKLYEILKELDEGKLIKDTMFCFNGIGDRTLIFDGEKLKAKHNDNFVQYMSVSELSTLNFIKIVPTIKDCFIQKFGSLTIRNHIGDLRELNLQNLDNEIVGEVVIIYNKGEDSYLASPIGNYISIPYLEYGTVNIIYKKLYKNCREYNFNANSWNK